MEQTDRDPRGEGRGDNGGKQGKGPKNMYEWPTDMDNSVGMDCGDRGDEQRRAKRGNWDNCNRTTIINNLK